MQCSVCRMQVRGDYYRSSNGTIWCARHQGMPECQWCGVPTRARGYGGPNCDGCKRTAITHTEGALASIRRVGSAMARRGFRISPHVRVVIDDRRDPQREGLFSSSPHQLGVTRYSSRARRQPTELTIALLEGMPAILFEACFAHEYGHALLAATPASRAPDWVGEGFAECVAFAYLTEDERSQVASMQARAIQANPDPTYGGGFRKVHLAVQRYGLRGVADALIGGKMRDVGL